MEDYDVIIVGGGPVGGYVAKEIAAKGFSVALFEEHRSIGLPLKCAGLVSSRVFNFQDVSKAHLVRNTLKGAYIHSPLGYSLRIGGDKIQAFAINRQLLDTSMVASAADAGADVFLAHTITSAKRHRNYIDVEALRRKHFTCKLLIGADGAHSKVREWFGLSPPTEFLRGIGAEVTDCSIDPDFVKIVLGTDIAPDFFAWIIPLNRSGTSAQIGLCVGHNLQFPLSQYFSNLFKNKIISSYLGDVKIKRKIGGVIPLGLLKKTYTSHILLVGDAASQVKPTSGGGLYTGLLCASHCSSVAIKALENNNFDKNYLKAYQSLWASDIGRELHLGMLFRTIFKNLDNQHFDKYIKKFQENGIKEVIVKYGDIDYPSKLLIPLMKKAPFLLTLLPNILKI